MAYARALETHGASNAFTRYVVPTTCQAQLPSLRKILTLEQTAERLEVSATCVRYMIERKLIPATQVVDCAPWEVPAGVLEDPDVRAAVSTVKNRLRRNGSKRDKQPDLLSRIERGGA